jgi:hypothetical protein
LKSEKYHCGYTVTKRLLRLYRSWFCTRPLQRKKL